MNVQEYLDKLPMGEVMDNRRVLAAMKRKGLIVDYSRWGYLESAHLWYNRWTMPSHIGGMFAIADTYDVYFGRKPKDGERGTCINPFMTFDDLLEAVPIEGIHYKGHFFVAKYFSGCFKPYLVKYKPPVRSAS